MHIMWFTERSYHYDPEKEPEKLRELETEVIRHRSFFGLRNELFDAKLGSELLNQFLDEKIYSD